jgi:hypothetical protein
MFRSAVIAVILVVAVGLTGATAGDDPLARKEFDQELSVGFGGADIADVFRMLAKVSHVPFVLDFAKDPSVSLKLKASNMSIRAILASLASTYDLSYAMSPAGVLVRRRGAPGIGKPLTLGAWPETPGRTYRLLLDVRGPGGLRVQPSGIRARLNEPNTFKLGVQGIRARTLDLERGVLEPAETNFLELRIYLKAETASGLEMLLELVHARATGPNSYTEEHTVDTKVAGNAATPLFSTSDGYEITLLGWKPSVSR